MTIINDNCWWWILIMVTDGQTDGLTTRYHDQKQAKNGLGKTSIKKNSKKSDIVTIRSGTYLPYLNSDIIISDICLKTLYLPTTSK